MTDAVPGPAAPRSRDEATPLAGEEDLARAGAFLMAASLCSFSWLAPLAGHAPDAASRLVFARLAARQTARLDVLEALAASAGVSVEELSASATRYLPALGSIGSRTAPGDWWERLARAFVTEGMIRDLQNQVAAHLPDDLRGAFLAANGVDAEDAIVVRLSAGIADDDALVHRLALWSRRVAGEVLGAVRAMLAGDVGVAAGVRAEDHVAAYVTAMTDGHARRMGRLGLAA